MSPFSSRKFLISLYVITSANVLLALGSLNATVWGSTVGAVVALYVAGNVTQRIGVKATPDANNG